jgi:hypothetical protein
VERHLWKYKLYFWGITTVVAIILALYGIEWKPTVLSEIKESLERRNIGPLITNVIENKVDEIALPEIGAAITNKVNPQLLKLFSANDDNSQLLEAMNQDKTSYSNLYLKANNPNSPDYYLEQMLGTISDRAAYDALVFIQSQTEIPQLGKNPTMLDFSNLYYVGISVNPFMKCVLLKQCWSETNLSERDKAGFLISSMRYDNNMVVVDTSATIINQKGNLGIVREPVMNLDTFDNWFKNNTNYFHNHDDYVEWAKTNQFIKK